MNQQCVFIKLLCKNIKCFYVSIVLFKRFKYGAIKAILNMYVISNGARVRAAQRSSVIGVWLVCGRFCRFRMGYTNRGIIVPVDATGVVCFVAGSTTDMVARRDGGQEGWRPVRPEASEKWLFRPSTHWFRSLQVAILSPFIPWGSLVMVEAGYDRPGSSACALTENDLQL